MRYLTLFILLFTSLFTQAQDAQKAKKLLDEVSAKIKSYDNISLEFRYSVTNLKEQFSQDSRGDLTVQGDKYVFNFMGTTEIFDGKKKYTIIPEDEEVSIENFDPKKDKNFTPSKMLTFFNSGYSYAWDKLLLLSGKKVQFIKLKPLDPKDERKEILLGVDNVTKNIYQLIETRKDGTRTELTVTSLKTNQPISKNHFTFAESKYPNYYINRID
jgi:outer membrane lipoprotein-sorting protein